MRALGPFCRHVGSLACITVAACSRGNDGTHDAGTTAAAADNDDAFVWPIASTESSQGPPQHKGMVYIPAGTLVAGTAKDKIPRLAEQELAAEPIAMRGFYIDEYAFPNEAGAIPKSGVSRDEAAALCATQGKRLCTELEWERACKGPGNTTYEYGEQYRPAECGTGGASRLAPSAMRVACKSAFGVHDLHGGAWEWTSSTWRRGFDATAGVVRGGNGEAGELVSRCANAMPLATKLHRPDVGTRCCLGEPNEAEVKLSFTRGKILVPRAADADLASQTASAIHDKAPLDLTAEQAFQVDRMFTWHPVGNEELLLATGCAKRSPHAMTCGAGVFHALEGGPPALIAFAPSSMWLPVVRPDRAGGRDVWVYGGDERSSFRRRVAYVWGKVAVGDPERPGPHRSIE